LDKKVLVAYATKYGATAEIAAKIGEVLSQAGVSAHVMPVDQVTDPGSYGAVILGSAVYIGRWRREAARFLKANEKQLSACPVWFFSSGPTGKGDPVELANGWRFPKSLQSIADRIGPREIALFHGVIDVDKVKSFDKWMIQKVGASTDDSRDWETIASWAESVAAELKKNS